METLRDIHESYRQGDFTSEALVRVLIDRIEKTDPELGSFSALFHDAALADARKRDEELSSGGIRGALHGIPVAIKDLAGIEGHVTTFGSRSYAQQPATSDATIVKRLRDAGAIILGTTRMVEFALGSWGTNTSTGTPRNPSDMETFRIAGGSSSGSAVAVAAGFVPAAIGSDTGGSIRIPASLCGVTGFKSTFGAVPLDGIASLSPSLDTIGPITRTVEDALVMHSVIAGRKPPEGELIGKPVRIGLLDSAQYGAVDQYIMAAFEAAVTQIRDNVELVQVFRLPRELTDYQDISSAVIAYEAYANLGAIASNTEAVMDPDVRGRVLAGSKVSQQEYRDFSRTMLEDRHGIRELFQRFDFLISPTTPIGAVELYKVDQSTIPMSRFTRFVNHLGLCAISLPIPHAGPLPAGLQIVGAADDDFRLLAFAQVIEAILNGHGGLPLVNHSTKGKT